jgi:Glycosyl hydrolase family 10
MSITTDIPFRLTQRLSVVDHLCQWMVLRQAQRLVLAVRIPAFALHISKHSFILLPRCLEGSAPAPTTTQQPPVTTSDPPATTSNPPVTSQPPATSTSNAPAGPTGSASPTGLHGRIGTKNNRYFGNILDSNTLNDNAVQSILNSDFGVITAENSMKWDATERKSCDKSLVQLLTVRSSANRGQFNFGGADNVANWATSRGKLIRGHTLGECQDPVFPRVC